MAALLYLKHAFNLSDEELVVHWSENVVWQYFSGQAYYTPKLPCDPTQIGRFRRVLGEAGVEELLSQTISTAVKLEAVERQALETVIVTWPNTPQSREASSRLGDLHVAARDNAAAVPAYAAALNGWPRTPWAPETTLKLAEALRATDRATQACGALTEFTRRYAETATPAQKTRATQLRTRANCS